MKILIKLIKKWYFIPTLLFILYIVVRICLQLYIQPVVLEESDNVWFIESDSFKLEINCKYLGGRGEVYEYRIVSEPHGLLDEVCFSATDLLLGQPVGIVFGNFDFDGEKELLILGCEGGPSKSIIPGLIDNIREFYYYKGDVMGYYDFQKGNFKFLHIEDSPFSGVIYDWYIDFFSCGNILTAMILYGILAAIFTGIFALINLLIVRMYRYFYKKEEV